MTKFLIGAIVGFLTCVWAVDLTPGDAFAQLWAKLQQVQEMSAAANQTYETANPQQADDRPATYRLRIPVGPHTNVDIQTDR